MWQKHSWRMYMAILGRVSLKCHSKGSSKVFCPQVEAQVAGGIAQCHTSTLGQMWEQGPCLPTPSLVAVPSVPPQAKRDVHLQSTQNNSPSRPRPHLCYRSDPTSTTGLPLNQECPHALRVPGQRGKPEAPY